MTSKVRSVVAVIVGALVAFILVAAIEALGWVFYPPPPGLDYNNPGQLRIYMQSLPLGAFLFVLAAWLIATFVGAWVACFIARTRPLLFAGIIGALILAGTIANLLRISHPTWFSITAVVAIPLAAFLASRLAPSGRRTL
jgi:hypothetical protein